MGDRLLSADADGSRLISVVVVALRRAEDRLFRVTYREGSLLCSSTHPLMLRQGGTLSQTSASRIEPGDLLVLEDLSATPVLSVAPEGTGPVVMITTEEDHLYFAGDAPVLGHNRAYIKYATTVETSAATMSGTGQGFA